MKRRLKVLTGLTTLAAVSLFAVNAQARQGSEGDDDSHDRRIDRCDRGVEAEGEDRGLGRSNEDGNEGCPPEERGATRSRSDEGLGEGEGRETDRGEKHTKHRKHHKHEKHDKGDKDHGGSDGEGESEG